MQLHTRCLCSSEIQICCFISEAYLSTLDRINISVFVSLTSAVLILPVCETFSVNSLSLRRGDLYQALTGVYLLRLAARTGRSICRRTSWPECTTNRLSERDRTSNQFPKHNSLGVWLTVRPPLAEAHGVLRWLFLTYPQCIAPEGQNFI